MNHPVTSLLLCIILALCAVSCSKETKTGTAQQAEFTQLAPRPTPARATTTTLGTNSTEQARLLEAWRISMAQIPLPKKGCFEASYPSTEWREVPSAKAPQHPMVPRRGQRPLTVGNGNNVSAQAPAGLISSATGSFDNVTGVTSESGQIGGTGPAVTNAYTLQLNMNFFPSTVGGSAECKGWEQFVFENDGGTSTTGYVYIQYWLIAYGTNSPGPGWNQFNGSDWWKNSSNSSATHSQPIGNLANLSLGGTASASGDSYFFSAGSSMYAATGDNLVNAAAGWNTAEFGVFGDGGGGVANFNSGSTIVVRMQIVDGGNAPPTCETEGFTGEMNNLNFGPTAPGASPPPPGPALFVAENTAGDAMATCAAATSVGESFWVDFNTGQNPPAGNGTYNDPVLTLAEGVNAVPTGGNVWIRTAGSSSETVPLSISKALTIHAYSGPGTVGQ